MTFELSSLQEAARDMARVFATARLAPHAAEIDRTSSVPGEIAHEALELLRRCADAGATVTALEEIAVASGAVAVAAAAGSKRAQGAGLSGLRGATLPDESLRAQLALAAVALGLGRAALDLALGELRRAGTHSKEGSDKPHWVIADVATELEAARLMTRAAAQAMEIREAATEVALARLMASAAAHATVDAALRITGPDGCREGALLERLSRDVRAVSVLMGTEEDHRATAAENLLPS